MMVLRASRSLLPVALGAGCLLLASPALAQRSGGGNESPLQQMPTLVNEAAAPKPPPPPFPVSILAVPFPISGAVDDQVSLLVEVGGRELLANNEGTDLAGQIEVQALDAAGTVVDQLAQPFVLDAADESLQRGGLKLYAVLRMPPGDYKLVATVRNETTHGQGRRELAFHAPDFARKEAALSPPLLRERAGRWKVFRQSDSPHEELPFPFLDTEGGGFLPAASPVMPTAGGVFVVYAYGPLTDAQQVQGRLLGSDGRPLPARVTVVDSGQGRFAIERRLVLRVDGPLPVGRARLEVSVADSAGAHSTSTPVLVLADEPPAEEVVAVEPQATQVPVDEEPVLPQGWTREQLGARFHDVLARAASGDLDGAASDLAELEVAAAPDRSTGQLKGLRQVETATLEVAMGSPHGLLPVVYLYVRADNELRKRNETWMAAQNRVFVGELVGRWVKANGNDATSRHLAAQLLAGLGSSAQAFEYEPTNELALLRVATSAEKGGLIAEAVAALQKLLAAHPGSSHGRLRMGILLRRQGQEAEATRLLTEVMGEAGASPWIRALACQELAAMAHDKGDRDRAEALLERGIETIGRQSLFVQLAFYLDERQRPDEAVAVLNGMPVTAGPTETSGRHMYNAPPLDEIALARRQVEARVAGEWPQLRAALRITAVPQQGSSR